MKALTSHTLPPWLKRGLALPNWPYAHGLGGLLGHRFVQLTHMGRSSGRTYHTVVEVVRYDRATGETTVMSGFGPKADWLRNIERAGGAQLDFGHGPRSAAYRILPVEEAARVMGDYERRNRLIGPVVNRVLSALLGWTYDGTPEARTRLVEALPLVAFRPAIPTEPRART